MPSRCKACGKNGIIIYQPDGMPKTMKKDRKDGKGFYEPD
jgi:hypothetical protein